MADDYIYLFVLKYTKNVYAVQTLYIWNLDNIGDMFFK